MRRREGRIGGVGSPVAYSRSPRPRDGARQAAFRGSRRRRWRILGAAVGRCLRRGLGWQNAAASSLRSDNQNKKKRSCCIRIFKTKSPYYDFLAGKRAKAKMVVVVNFRHLSPSNRWPSNYVECLALLKCPFCEFPNYFTYVESGKMLVLWSLVDRVSQTIPPLFFPRERLDLDLLVDNT